MAENTNELELKDRLELIESMLAAGRRKTGNWGWTFVLWGVAYYVAIAWATFGRSDLAWPVTMIAAAIITGIVASRRKKTEPTTTICRAISSIWIALGISVFLLLMAISYSHRLDGYVSLAIFCAMLGMANATSGMILKWKMQLACAVVWWSAAVAVCYADANQGSIIVLAAIFFCQIVFGIYAMILSSKSARVAAHA